MKSVPRLLCCTMLLALFLATCGPSATPLPPATLNAEVPTAVSQPVGTPQPEAVVTSRGDKLEASDPASVKYGAGRPVLIEFFRFT